MKLKGSFLFYASEGAVPLLVISTRFVKCVCFHECNEKIAHNMASLTDKLATSKSGHKIEYFNGRIGLSLQTCLAYI